MSEILKAACRLQHSIIMGTVSDLSEARNRALAMLRVAAIDKDWDGAGAAQQALDLLGGPNAQ